MLQGKIKIQIILYSCLSQWTHMWLLAYQMGRMDRGSGFFCGHKWHKHKIHFGNSSICRMNTEPIKIMQRRHGPTDYVVLNRELVEFIKIGKVGFNNGKL